MKVLRNVLITAALVGLSPPALAQSYEPTYVGDQECALCHAHDPYPGFFEGYRLTGHPWKVLRTGGEIPGIFTWPFTPVPPLPVVNGTQLQWSDVEMVIGNYNWKARFIDRDGFIHTGGVDDRTQFNLATQEFVPYHAGELDKPFDCGRCHTTGYSPEGNQYGLPGFIGTWSEEGVRCEACHGPGSDHIDDPELVLPSGGKTCAECHYRDDDFRMPWKGGFMRHHQQSEEMSHSPHSANLSCISCHNPHKSVTNDLDGIIKDCTDCHAGSEENGFYVVDKMEEVGCTSCHMPKITKNATAANAHTGDIPGHLFAIMTDPIAAEDNTYDVNGSLFWNQDANGDSFNTLDYSCLGCHINFDDMNLAEASEYAVDIHNQHPAGGGTPCPADIDGDDMVAFSDLLGVLSSWGPCADCPADIDNDGMVGFSDLLAVLAAWGPC